MLDYLLAEPPNLVGFVFVGIVLVTALSLHEFGHALAAELQGDHTAKNMGRLTLNPLKHLDPVGTFMIVLAGFGWGKPVPFNLSNLRSKRFGAAIVGGAGPLVNILLAFLAAILISRLSPTGRYLSEFLQIMFGLNVLLAVFNLLPIPPLDGSRILSAVLPPDKQKWIYFLDRWGFVALIIVVFFLFEPVLGPVVRLIGNLIMLLVNMLP